MKRIIAGKYIDNIWHPQQEVEMDVDDQSMFNSFRNMAEIERDINRDLTDRQKFDMLLNEGPEKTKQALSDINDKKNELRIALELAKKEHQKIFAKYVKSRGK